MRILAAKVAVFEIDQGRANTASLVRVVCLDHTAEPFINLDVLAHVAQVVFHYVFKPFSHHEAIVEDFICIAMIFVILDVLVNLLLFGKLLLEDFGYHHTSRSRSCRICTLLVCGVSSLAVRHLRFPHLDRW